MDLIERLEKASDGSRELDAEIHVKVNGWKLSPVPKDYDGLNAGETYTPDGKPIPGFVYPPKGKIGLYYHVPDRPQNQYTRNMEAALSLFPFGRHTIEIDSGFASVNGHTAKAANSRLALCIAALRARQTAPAASST